MEKTKIYSIVLVKCPRCHQGPLFVNSNPYKMKNWDVMHEDCPVCGLHYELEPGFFQGAMYVSYALGVALSVAIFLIYWLFIGFNPLGYMIANTAALVGFAPLLFRWARSLYLNLFVKYEPYH